MGVGVGTRITFAEEKQCYTVQACNDRFAVCIKPFNARKTFLYTIIDFREGVRGTENQIFCAGFETRTECEEALERLANSESEVSHRNRVPLKIERLRPERMNCIPRAKPIKRVAA